MVDDLDRERALQRLETLAVAISVRSLPHVVGPLLETDLTLKQLKVLSMLAGPTAPTLSELARDSGVSLATMSGILGKLVQRDLVERVVDPGDQRARRLSPTALGRTVMSTVLAPRPHLAPEILARLSTEELTALETGMAAVNRELSQRDSSA